MYKRNIYTADDMYWYWFVNIRGIGEITRRKMLELYSHPRKLFHLRDSAIRPLLKKDQYTSFMRSKNMKLVEEGLSRLSEADTRFVHWESPDYPGKFRQMTDPPYGFYLRGRLPDENRLSLAIIGSRLCTGYGRKIAEQFAGTFARWGIQIISGLAEGIDTAGHRGARKAGGYTLGVLGGGIDTIYPRENFNLYMDMYRSGGVLSEWNLGVANHPGLFPKRNRLISALSDGIFVVEAAKRSGTFITVDQALDQGKTVFALPGRITDFNSIGTNQLICDGAIPVTCPGDILDYFGVSKPAAAMEEDINYSDSPAVSDITYTRLRKNSCLISDPDQKKVLAVLDEKIPKDFDTLLEVTGYDIQSLRHILYEMEIKHYIVQLQQNIYLKNL